MFFSVNYFQRGVLLIATLLLVAFFSYGVMETAPYLSALKKQFEEEDYKMKLLQVKRALNRYIQRNGELYFFDPETGQKVRLDFDTPQEKIYYALNLLLRKGSITYSEDGKVSFKMGGYLRQGMDEFFAKNQVGVTRNLLKNSSFENAYVDRDVNKVLVEGWDANQGYGRATILTGETPTSNTAKAYSEDDSFGFKTIVIEKYR